MAKTEVEGRGGRGVDDKRKFHSDKMPKHVKIVQTTPERPLRALFRKAFAQEKLHSGKFWAFVLLRPNKEWG